jgi:transmembrane sensor
MSTNELKRLAEKYFEGTASEQEKQQLHQWYDATNDGWVEVVKTTLPEDEVQIKQRIYKNLQKRIQQERGLQPSRRTALRRILLPAASVAAFLLAGLFVFRSADKQAKPIENQLVKAPSGKVIQILLADGSKVWLNAGSVFKYPKKFNGKVREVELVEGRAFFDIKHLTDRPFLVKTHNLNVTVLGTSFDVRAYQREGKTKVSVVTGKVGITLINEPAEPAIMLVAKQEIIWNTTTRHAAKTQTKEAVVNLWCKDVLVFEQEDLSNVFKAIEKKYNTKITVTNNELLKERISITLGNQRLDTIMEILSFTKHFNYKMANDSTVVVK